MDEIWKDIQGYEGYYKASNLGRIKSQERKINRSNGTSQIIKERILKVYTSSGGYLRVKLYKDLEKKIFSVSRIVAIAFNLPKEDFHEDVDHKNNNKTDNRVDNLQWMTSRGNSTKRSLQKNKTSKYHGVSLRGLTKKWRADIYFKGIKYFLGYYNLEEDAYEAVTKFEKENNIIR
jgi:hypothetical protein